MSDLGPLGVFGEYGLELADRLSSDYGDDFKLGELLIVAEVFLPDGSTSVEVLSSERRAYVAGAILNRAMDIIGMREDAELEPPDDDD